MIRIDFSSMESDGVELTKEAAYNKLLGMIADDSIDLKRLSKWVFILDNFEE